MVVLSESLKRAISTPGRLIRPPSVLGVALVEGTFLVDEVAFDAEVSEFFRDPVIGFKLYGMLQSARDFVHDSFDPGEHCAACQLGNWWLTGHMTGECLLVAVSLAGGNLDWVESWLVRIGRLLRKSV